MSHASDMTAPRSAAQTSCFAQHLEERVAVALELDRADAGDAQQLDSACAGRAAAICAEHGVAEHDVGGHALGVGEPLAQRAQALEQLAVVVGLDRRRRAAAPPRARVGRVAAPPPAVAPPPASSIAVAAAHVARRAARLDRLVEVPHQRLVAAAAAIHQPEQLDGLAPRLRAQRRRRRSRRGTRRSRSRRPTSRTARSRSAARRGRRGRSPGTRPRRSAACRGGRRSARCSCRCPCRTRRSRRPRRPRRARRRPGCARARRRRARRGTATRAHAAARAATRSSDSTDAPAQAVDDAALARVARARCRGCRGACLRALPPFLLRRDTQVRAEERALEAVGLPHAELADDVARDRARRGGGERQHRDVAELALEPVEPAVGGPEVVPPVADAVRLVDHHQAHRAVGDEPRSEPSSASGAR